MDLAGLNLGALTIPVFATIFSMGWSACYVWVARPLKERVANLEKRQNELENLLLDRLFKT